MTELDASRAVILHSALGLAVDSIKKQLGYKKQDLFRSAALKALLGQCEAERVRLEDEFPVLDKSVL